MAEYEVVDGKYGKRIEGFKMDADFNDEWISRVTSDELREEIACELNRAYEHGATGITIE